MRGRIGDAVDEPAAVAVEHRTVLGQREASRRVAHRVEVGIERAPIDGVELGPLHPELGAVLEQRLHHAQATLDAGRRVVHVLGAPACDRLLRPAVRAVDVDQAARGEEVAQRPGRLFVDLLPRRRRDGRELTEQVVHRGGSLLRSPIASDPADVSPASFASASASCSTSTIGRSVNR